MVSHKTVIGACIVTAALLFSMGNSGCQSSGVVSGGSSGKGITIGGFPDGVGTLVRPVGVAVKGEHPGEVIWIGTGAVAGVIAARIAHLMGGKEQLSSNKKDPCKGKSDNVKVWGTYLRIVHKQVTLNCREWRRIIEFNKDKLGKNPVKTVLQCITKVLQYGLANGYNYSLGLRGTVSFDPNGNLFSATSDNWELCAVY